ncbi:hypothetical protein E2562_029679 [Oryza meyeriana var. granulata]|uniref:Uncharacterized protein n=1 Tax=Oryza meyeriana var. granulata TaxID=110450 RepID=A0A6G1BZJ8_9ORYZ|nr:hypothetical protein E2562_029679 [Oryza meyeriana var. granulata]
MAVWRHGQGTRLLAADAELNPVTADPPPSPTSQPAPSPLLYPSGVALSDPQARCGWQISPPPQQ